MTLTFRGQIYARQFDIQLNIDVPAGLFIDQVKLINVSFTNQQGKAWDEDLSGPDLIILGDTRIIKPNILRLPKIGIVNVHPGFLPDVLSVDGTRRQCLQLVTRTIILLQGS